ncbi:glycoside hydrolase superfamily [Bisporella sp. PMI_857]|nr:glycoside hydrolase superfamily [Bisporella sp. PMI_857]
MKTRTIFLLLCALISASFIDSTSFSAAGIHHAGQKKHSIEARPRLVMYAQTFLTKDDKPVSLLPLLSHQTLVTHIILASIHLHDYPGVIKLNDEAFDSAIYFTLWEDVRYLQKAGVKVMGLLGGAAGGTYNRLSGSETEFYTFYHPLARLIKEYSLDGLDIDIEEDVDISVPLRLMNALYRDFGPDFIITLTPLASALSSKTGQNPSGFSYFDLDSLATVPGSETNLISWYNTMFYGEYPRGPPTYDTVIEAGWDPSRVVMVVLDNSENGPPNGFQRIANLQVTIKGMRRAFPHFGGVAGWEYHNAGASDADEMQPWQWVHMVGEALFGWV